MTKFEARRLTVSQPCVSVQRLATR